MPHYEYHARDEKGGTSTGVLTAESMTAAGHLVRSEGKYITNLKEVAGAKEKSFGLSVNQHARRVKRKDVMFFANQLSIMFETGVPINEAMECVVDHATNPNFKAVAQEIAAHVQQGGELSAALKRFPRLFPTIMVSLVKASEASGTMGIMLKRASHYLDQEEKTRRQVKGALMYPTFLIFMSLGITVLLLAFVLPRFASIYSAKQAALPAPTRILMALSDSLVQGWYFWLGGLIATIFFGSFILKKDVGKRGVDWLKLNLPVLKGLFTALYVSRACRAMGTMISVGVPILDTVSNVKEINDNVYYRELWEKVDESLRKGTQLSDALIKSNLFPKTVVQMIRSGEKAGRLGEVMNRVAQYTEEECDQAVKDSTQFIEPVMMIVMGGLIGFVAISLLLPIFSVSQVAAK